jgi:hypothetical protein
MCVTFSASPAIYVSEICIKTRWKGKTMTIALMRLKATSHPVEIHHILSSACVGLLALHLEIIADMFVLKIRQYTPILNFTLPSPQSCASPQ